MIEPAPLEAPGVPAPPISLALDNPWPTIARGVAIASMFFIGLVGWAACVSLDSAVIARGVVIVSGNRQAVQHLDGGIVKAIYVKEGDRVEAGQPLLALDDAELVSQERALAGRLVELEAWRARLHAESAGLEAIARPSRWSELSNEDMRLATEVLERQNRELDARTASTQAKLVVLREQVQELQARLPGQKAEYDSLLEQRRLLDRELEDLSGLREKGLVPQTRINALQRQRADIDGRAGRLEASMAETRKGISGIEGQIASLLAERRSEQAADLQDVELQISDVAPKYEGIVAKLQRTILRAPASGEVVGLTAFTIGGVIQPGTHVMDIVPSGRELVIEANISPEDADEVQIGMLSTVRFPGLHGRNIPEVSGTVSAISADRIVDQASGIAHFRIEVQVPAAELEAIVNLTSGALPTIRPGIPAEAAIRLRARTALQYIVDPLGQALWRSFREH